MSVSNIGVTFSFLFLSSIRGCIWKGGFDERDKINWEGHGVEDCNLEQYCTGGSERRSSGEE
jgi:hypothetical protein